MQVGQSPAAGPALPALPEPAHTDLFVAGQDGYHTYRIPALVASARGALLAFCEGRRRSRADYGDVDLVLRRSLDNGGTWGPMQIIWDDGGNTIGNPCPVLDRDTGTIWLLLTRNLGADTGAQIMDGTSKGSRTVWVMRSADEGATWSEPREITQTTKGADWTFYATGPGHGIQLRSGRLLIPCDHAVAGTKAYQSHVIYSDDQGATWKLGGVLTDKTNECEAVETVDGLVYLNMRSYHGRNRRAYAWSKDGGQTWSEVELDEALVEPVCQASIVRFTDKPRHGRNRVLFCNPASTKREKLTVRLSYDECNTWSAGKVLHEGPSAYSDLCIAPDMSICCLYEQGERDAYERITFAQFSLEWLTDGADHLVAM